MTRIRPQQRGFAAIAAIFLVVVLAALGGFMVSFSNTQQLTSARDLQGSRAYWAARGGLAWGVASLVASNAACPSGDFTSAAGRNVDGYTVLVTCSRTVYADSGGNVVIYRLDARASLGVAGGSNYVERSVSASMEM
jgi:MSHA biogenesis protein MshP